IAASSSAAFHDPVSSRHTPPKGEISGSTTDSLVLGLHIIFCCTLQMHGVWFWSSPSMKHTSPSHRRCTPPRAQSSYHVERPPGGRNARIFEAADSNSNCWDPWQALESDHGCTVPP